MMFTVAYGRQVASQEIVSLQAEIRRGREEMSIMTRRYRGRSSFVTVRGDRSGGINGHDRQITRGPGRKRSARQFVFGEAFEYGHLPTPVSDHQRIVARLPDIPACRLV